MNPNNQSIDLNLEYSDDGDECDMNEKERQEHSIRNLNIVCRTGNKITGGVPSSIEIPDSPKECGFNSQDNPYSKEIILISSQDSVDKNTVQTNDEDHVQDLFHSPMYTKSKLQKTKKEHDKSEGNMLSIHQRSNTDAIDFEKNINDKPTMKRYNPESIIHNETSTMEKIDFSDLESENELESVFGGISKKYGTMKLLLIYYELIKSQVSELKKNVSPIEYTIDNELDTSEKRAAFVLNKKICGFLSEYTNIFGHLTRFSGSKIGIDVEELENDHLFPSHHYQKQLQQSTYKKRPYPMKTSSNVKPPVTKELAQQDLQLIFNILSTQRDRKMEIGALSTKLNNYGYITRKLKRFLAMFPKALSMHQTEIGLVVELISDHKSNSQFYESNHELPQIPLNSQITGH